VKTSIKKALETDAAEEGDAAGFLDDPATEDFPDLVVSLVAAALALGSLAETLVANRGTTIELHTTPTLIVLLLLAVPVGAWLLWRWFRPRPMGVAPPEWNLKHDAPGLWVIKGVMISSVTSALLAWFGYLILNLVAQRLSGPSTSIAATVVELRDVRSDASPCNL
jgi:hypothetical protein